MERPQPRPFGTQGRKPTHDFLSLYSAPPVAVQQDSRPSPSPAPAGAFLETHDFLQPLERVGKNIAKEGNKIEVTSVEKPPPPAPPPSVEHTLPGGIGTYTISHISYVNQSQRIPKPEGGMFTAAQSSSSDRNNENSNCSSYTGSGFNLWAESAMKKGKTGKENIAGDRQVIKEAGMRRGGGQWTTSSEQPSLSSSNHNLHSTAFSSMSTSLPSPAPKKQSFVDMIKSARTAQEDDDEEEEEFVIKTEPSSNHKGNLLVKVDPKSTDQKPNTPRSKHSATEQRRRSKINDRFSMLRELIPHSDQKRDKASFLLEVIEYIQFLQEKVNKYEEDSFQGWNNEPTKLIPWSNGHRSTEGFIHQPRGSNCTSGPALMYAKIDENNIVAPTIPRNGQNLVESNTSSADTIKELGHQSRLTNKASPFPVAFQPNIFSPGGSCSAAAPLATETDNGASQTQSQLWHSRSCTTDCSVKLKEQELTIESGTISVSAVYSQGLLNNLTQALQSSGVDLSQANISVQIDLGKRPNSSTTLNSSTSMPKKNDLPSSNQALKRSRLASSTGEEFPEQACKRFKTSIS